MKGMYTMEETSSRDAIILDKDSCVAPLGIIAMQGAT